MNLREAIINLARIRSEHDAAKSRWCLTERDRLTWPVNGRSIIIDLAEAKEKLRRLIKERLKSHSSMQEQAVGLLHAAHEFRDDPETAHLVAEAVMLELLREAAFEKVVTSFEALASASWQR